MQAQRRFKTQDAVELTFKRHILEKTSAFASAPQEDLYRVQMLGMMLDRYDELLQSGLTEQNACAHVLDAFDGLALQMQEMGFEELEPGEPASGWPPLGDRDVETYLCEQDAYRHRIALGAACFSASLSPVIVTNALTELFGFGGDAFVMENNIGYLDLAKDNIARALSELIDDGWIGRDDAESLALDFLYRNPKEFFQL